MMKDKKFNDHVWLKTYQSSANISIFAMLTVAAIEMYMLGLTVAMASLYGPLLWRYRGFYLSLLLMVLAYIGVTLYVKKDFPARYKILNIINPLSAIFFFSWAVGTTFNDFLVLGTVDTTVFMTFSFSVPLCFYVAPHLYAAIAVVADCMMVYLAAISGKGIGLVINIVIFCIFQLILCVSFLYVKKKLSEELLVTEEQRDEIEKLSASKTLFFSSVSHEIRTPINGILGMDDMILRESKEKGTLEYARNIKIAGTTLLYLVNDILDSSRLNSGKMTLIPVDYESKTMFHDLFIIAETRAADKGLALYFTIDEKIPTMLYGDEIRIKQVLMNLLTNALKYTEKGSVTLEASATPVDEDHVDILFSIKDTGIGIKEEDIKKLFDVYGRIDEERNRKVEGTGLGMNIVNKLLDLMGSKLSVSSQYQKGSEFSFVLRQKVVSWEPVGQFDEKWQEAAVETEFIEPSFTAPEARVLVVDDNRMNQKVAGNLLGLFGIKPVFADSGMQALEEMKKNRFDLVMLDHMMPGMDGRETLERLKKENLLPKETKAIALTAKAGEGVRKQYLQWGFDDYLSKPMDIAAMDEVIKEWLPEALKKEKKREEEASGEVVEFEPMAASESIVAIEFDPEEETESDEASGETGVLDALRASGIDADSGLRYCGSDEEFYLEMLTDYVNDLDKRKNELDAFFSKEEWHDFGVSIHALKSVSKTIGASKMAQKALSLEEAAGRDDGAFIQDNYEDVMQEYQRIVGVIQKIINENGQ